jgi:hypothetical protein
MTPIRDTSCCPTFFIAVIGPWLLVLGAVFVDRIVVQELTDFIWIGGHPFDDAKITRVARILTALGNGLGELEDYYSRLATRQSPKDSQRFFPYLRQFVAEGRVVKFSYRAYLVGKSPESHAKPIFLATIEEGREPNRKVVVKFVQTYNARAHRVLTAAGQAPELLYCSTEDDQSEYLGGLIMVVMGYVDGKTAQKRYEGKGIPPVAFEQVEKAVLTLHGEDIVFGDLRLPNIVVKDEGKVMLIDFDWCGRHGVGTYPVSLNDDPDKDKGIDWHPDVKRGGKMMKAHDIYRLNCLKLTC